MAFLVSINLLALFPLLTTVLTFHAPRPPQQPTSTDTTIHLLPQNWTHSTVVGKQHSAHVSASHDDSTGIHYGGSRSCVNPRRRVGCPDACRCVLSQRLCYSGNSFKYVRFFFCTCKRLPALGYVGLISLLLLLFYLLGTTAADYFSCTIDKLSEILRLSPAVAGVTLLAIGNGAPDVFSSIAAVIASHKGSLGLSTVLGGSIFLITVVSGSLSIAIATTNGTRCIKLDAYSFFRDILFFLVSLGALAGIIWDGKIYWAEALFLLCIYLVYAAVVVAVEIMLQRNRRDPLLQPFLEGSLLPHVAIYAHQDPICKDNKAQFLGSFWGRHIFGRQCVQYFYIYAIEWPLNFPRRLTIPFILENRWSRRYAVASCVLAPLSLTFLWYCKSNASATTSGIVFGAAGLLATVLGSLAFLKTESGCPPKRFQFLWLTGGFVMSVVWIYVVAQELVAVLLSLGIAFNIDSSILGLTVLAWGNSIGDLVGNLFLAYNARNGVQIAMCGCYAGPMFNTLVGLGLSSLVATWMSPLPISENNNLLCTISFTLIGLIWALVMVPTRKMRLTRGFGTGLIFLYMGFMITSLTLFPN